MDAQTISKDKLVQAIREAITHCNRNIYEWTVGSKVSRIKLTFDRKEIYGLAKSWLIRKLRPMIGPTEADRIFKGMSISMGDDYVSGIYLSDEGGYCRDYTTIRKILQDMNFEQLRYNPDDYVTDGMAERKSGFDSFFFVDFEDIKNVKF